MLLSAFLFASTAAALAAVPRHHFEYHVDAHPITHLNQPLVKNATFDYVVVGGGTAGLTIASRLALRNFHVAVVEAGGFYEFMRPISEVPGAACLGAGADIRTASIIDWGFVAKGGSGANYRDIHYPRGKCLGGSYESIFFCTVQKPFD